MRNDFYKFQKFLPYDSKREDPYNELQMYSCDQYFQDKISIHILPSRNKENHTDSNLDNSTLSVHTKEVVKHLWSIWIEGEGGGVEQIQYKISLFLAYTTLLPSTPPPSPFHPNRPLRSKEIGKYNQRDTHKRRNPIKKN